MIGIFDSGIGGITIFKEILKKSPNINYIYYSDSINNPYGDHPKSQIIKISENVITYLLNQGCQIIVIACNTASTVVNVFRKKYPDIIFVATEPAYKLAHDKAYNNKTLVIATKRTIESKKFLKLYKKYDNHQTITYSCQGLAELIENNNQKEIDEYLKFHLSKFKGVKNVVLGCTHYPLIKKNIKNILGEVNFFDGSIGVSNEVERKIQKLKLKGNGNITFIDSSNNKEKEQRFWQILKENE